MHVIPAELNTPLPSESNLPQPVVRRSAVHLRVARWINRLMEPYAAMPLEAFATTEYRLLTESVRPVCGRALNEPFD